MEEIAFSSIFRIRISHKQIGFWLSSFPDDGREYE